jgi:hypothetical protein
MTSQQPRYPTLYHGAFCIYFSRDENLILLIDRGNNEGFGVPSGYIDIANGKEQPRQGAVRELGEEVIFPDGSAVLATVTPERLTVVDSGIDYSAGIPGTKHMGNSWSGHKCELTSAEVKILKAHIAKMNADPDYADAVRKRSNGELKNVILLNPDDFQNRLQAGTITFRYPHEQTVALTVAAQMKPEQKPHAGQKPGPA